MTSKVKRSENMLSKLGEQLGMTDAGKSWVTASLDPFHDNPIDSKGYPDGSISKNIVQTIKQSMTITSPPGLATTATWDCHVVQWPWANKVPITAFKDGLNGSGTTPHYGAAPYGAISVDPIQATFCGGLSAYACPTGHSSAVSDMIAGLAANTASNTSLVLPNPYRVGKRRIIGIGFEVYNVSAQLYRGGSVTCYRQPVESFDDAQTTTFAVASAGVGINIVASKIINMSSPPANPAAALLMPYSRQWDAEQGCYCVGAFNTAELANHNSYPLTVVINDPYTIDGSHTDNNSYCTPLANYTTTLTGSQVLYGPGVVDLIQIDQTGAYFTGLTPQSSLLINYTIYLERFPTFDDQDLIVLAKPPPERDDIALKFYSHASDQLPVGVPVKENGLGDWFKDVIGTASDFIAPVLSAIPHPAAQGVGMLIKGTNAVVNRDRVPELPPSNARSSAPAYTPRQEAAKVAVKNKNVLVRAKNAEIRAKNEEIRARKALKATKKKK